MSIRYVNVWELDAVWPHAEKYIQDGLEYSRGEMNASQARYAITMNLAELFVCEDEHGINGAVLVNFVNYPNYRVAHISSLGGKGVMHNFDDLKALLKRAGASYVDAQCRDSVMRMTEKYNMKKICNVVRCEL